MPPVTTDTINLTSEAVRKLMIVAVDVSETEDTPEWELQGYKTEDASLELNPDITTITDVLGDTYSDLNKFEKAMSFEPNTLRPISNKGKLNEILLKYERHDQLSKFSRFKVLVAHGYLGDVGAYGAETYSACLITPSSLGGSSRVNFPYDINFGGIKVLGTVDKLQAGLKFTPDTTV